MKKYYYVPVTSGNVKHDGITLKEHLKYVDYELYNRECDFLEFVYGRIFSIVPKGMELNKIIEKQREEDEILYKEHFIPDRLIIVKDEDNYYELVSNEKIERPNLLFIDSYEIKESQVQRIMEEDPEYQKKVIQFFHTYQNRTKLMQQRIEKNNLEESEDKPKIKKIVRLVERKNKN